MRWPPFRAFLLLPCVVVAACSRKSDGARPAGAHPGGATSVASVTGGPLPAATSDFFAERAAHPTVLAVHGPSPQEYPPWPSHGAIEVVEYPSGNLTLRGLLVRPVSHALDRGGRAPALVYLHGGFALAEADVADGTPFLREGFVVFAPALRGENGNPGDHELAFHELDDARAAIDFIRTRNEVDPARVVVFGHSAGGMLSALLTLYADLPVLDTGSAGGLYGAGMFDSMKRPFVDSPVERGLRLFAPYAAQMKHPHFACVGDGDRFPREVSRTVEAIATAQGLPFTRQLEPGDHFKSLPPCVEAFLARVKPKVQ